MRVMIAGTNSGCGKTTVTLALLTALRKRGVKAAPFKSGPDYIDPGFHRFAAGRLSHNLDLFLMGEAGVRQVLSMGMEGCDLGIIEGAMSYYDGIGAEGACSAHALAKATQTPAVLVIDAAGSASGAAAVALGFRDYAANSGIAGVLVNRISSQSHYDLVRRAVEDRTGLTCVGYMRKSKDIHLDSRHLGLVPAEELPNFRSKLEDAASLLEVDFDKLENLARHAGTLDVPSAVIPCIGTGFRMGLARDEAFSFYYEANLEMLRRMGAELVEFSPLRDAALPPDLDGLYLGGGFPEVFARRLSENTAMRASVRAALEGGLRCYAECGGMMYLSQAIDGIPMVGFFPFSCSMTARLQRFGYVEVTDRQTGMTFPAHEFHHSLESGDEDLRKVFEIRKAANRETVWQGGYRKKRTLAGYPHIHFWNRPALVNELWGLDGDRLCAE